MAKTNPGDKITKASKKVASVLKSVKKPKADNDKTIDGGTLKTVEIKGQKPKKPIVKAEDSVSYGAFTEKGGRARPKMSVSEYSSVNKELFGKDEDAERTKQSRIMENMDKVRKVLSKLRTKK